MTSKTKKSDERTPLLSDRSPPQTNKVKRSTNLCTASLVAATFMPCLGGFLCGYDQTVMETIQALPNFQSHFYHGKHLTHCFNPLDYLIFGYFSMAILGSLYSGYVCDQAGRKPSLIGALLLFSTGTLLSIGCRYAWLFLFGRLLVGFGSGMLLVASPCLITELAPGDLRGCLVGFFTLLAMAGQLSGYYMMLQIEPNVSTSSSHHRRHFGTFDWRFSIGLETCLCIMMILIQWQLPESPRWLAHQQNTNDTLRDEGLQVIAYLHEQQPDDVDVQQLWKRIKTDSNDTTTFRYFDLIRSNNDVYDRQQRKRRWLVVGGIILANQMTGYDTLVKHYASAIFYASGLQEANPFVATGCTRSLALAATAISLGWCVDQTARKWILFVGSLVVAMCHLGLAGVFQWFSVVDWQTGSLFLMDVNARMVAIACVYIFIVVYAFTWGSLVLTMSCELFSNVDRAKGVAVVSCLVWSCRWLLMVSSPWCFAISPSLVFFIYGFSMLASAWFVYFWIPHTTKTALEDIAEIMF
ncbi:general substrate transporter [Chlamydoabsidia padenii]|nr:general substrate transporter [Chlamydoabsidia padenii]